MHWRASRMIRAICVAHSVIRRMGNLLPCLFAPLALAVSPAAGASVSPGPVPAASATGVRGARESMAELGDALEEELRAGIPRAQAGQPDSVLAEAKHFYGRLISEPVQPGRVLPQRDSSSQRVGRKNLVEDNAKTSRAGRVLLQRALAYRGTPYRWGGASREGLDCSGLVLRALSDIGRRAPHSAALQSRLGKPVADGDLQPGDLVFFENTYKPGISHVGIYEGDSRFIHASSVARKVAVGDLGRRYFRERYAGARRLLAPDILENAQAQLESAGDTVFAPFRLGLP